MLSHHLFILVQFSLLSCFVNAQESELVTDGSIVYMKTSDLVFTSPYTSDDHVLYEVPLTYWLEVSSVTPTFASDGPLPTDSAAYLTYRNSVYVWTTALVSTDLYSSDNGIWSFVTVETFSYIGVDTASRTQASDTTTPTLYTTLMQKPEPSQTARSLSVAATTPDETMSSTSATLNPLSDSNARPSHAVLAGCIIGGVALVVVTILVGWIIHAQRQRGHNNQKEATDTPSAVLRNSTTAVQPYQQPAMGRTSLHLPIQETRMTPLPKSVRPQKINKSDRKAVHSPLEPHYTTRFELLA